MNKYEKQLAEIVQNVYGEMRSNINGDLYIKCYNAWEHANTGPWDVGSNYWMVMFVDNLLDQLLENINEQST